METSIIVQSTHSVGLEFVLSVLGILTGLIATIILFEKRSTIAENVNKGITFIIYGILLIVVATMWDLFFMFIRSAPKFFEDIHPLFVTIGMIFFILAAQRFSSGDSFTNDK